MATETLFEKLYSATDDLIKKMQKPLVERKLKRKMESAWDDAENRKIQAEERINKARKNFENFDVNEILEQKKLFKQCKDLQIEIEVEFKDYFGEKLNR